jgi:peptidyl-prolyl cis-trans isomerase B (cyclophilin B)
VPSNEQRRTNAKRKLERQIARRAERAKRRRTIAVVATVLGVVVVVAGIYLVATGNGEDDRANAEQRPKEQIDKPQSIPVSSIALPKRPKPLPATVSCEYKASPEPASKPVQKPRGKDVSTEGTVTDTLRTSAGDFKLKLDRGLAPCAVNSFVSLSKQGYFDNTRCHRLTVTGLQVLQCGDPSGTGSGGPGYSFADEVFPQLKYGRGTLAMANAGPNTNGSQFFIVYGSAALPPQYTVFGSIDDESLKRVDKVARTGTIRATDPSTGQPTPGDGKPKQDVTIQKASIVA